MKSTIHFLWILSSSNINPPSPATNPDTHWGFKVSGKDITGLSTGIILGKYSWTFFETPVFIDRSVIRKKTPLYLNDLYLK